VGQFEERQDIWGPSVLPSSRTRLSAVQNCPTTPSVISRRCRGRSIKW